MCPLQAPNDILPDQNVREHIPDAELDIIWVITLWYNGVPIKHGDRVYHIGRHKPPELDVLLDCTKSEWVDKYLPAYDNLDSRGAFRRVERNNKMKPPVILRRSVDWAPSAELLNYASDLFGDLVRQLVPRNRYKSSKGHVGDSNETLTHRTMVSLACSYAHQNDKRVRQYPDNQGKPKPDALYFNLTWNGSGMKNCWGIEALTDHNDLKMCVRKHKHFRGESSRKHLWIFEDREHVGKVLNQLQKLRSIDIKEGEFENSENYAVERYNNLIQKSNDCAGIDRVETLSTLYKSIEYRKNKQKWQSYDFQELPHHNTSVFYQ